MREKTTLDSRAKHTKSTSPAMDPIPDNVVFRTPKPTPDNDCFIVKGVYHPPGIPIDFDTIPADDGISDISDDDSTTTTYNVSDDDEEESDASDKDNKKGSDGPAPDKKSSNDEKKDPSASPATVTESQAEEWLNEIKKVASRAFVRVVMRAGTELVTQAERMKRKYNARTLDVEDVRLFLSALEPGLESPLISNFLMWILNRAEDTLRNFLNARGLLRDPDAPLDVGTLVQFNERKADKKTGPSAAVSSESLPSSRFSNLLGFLGWNG